MKLNTNISVVIFTHFSILCQWIIVFDFMVEILNSIPSRASFNILTGGTSALAAS